MDGAQIVVSGENNYFFAKRDNSSQVTLQDGSGTNVNWPRASGGSKTWRIFQTVYALASTLDWVWSLTVGDDPMDEIDGGLPALNDADPDRSTTDSVPSHWTHAGVDSLDKRRIEVWPVPTSAALMRGTALRRPPTLADVTTIDVPRALLVYWSAADACNMLAAKENDNETWKNLALYYTREAERIFNEYGPVELARLSPPSSLVRRRNRFSRRVGTDWEVTHQVID